MPGVQQLIRVNKPTEAGSVDTFGEVCWYDIRQTEVPPPVPALPENATDQEIAIHNALPK